MKYFLSVLFLSFSVSSFSEIITVDTGDSCKREFVEFVCVTPNKEGTHLCYVDVCTVATIYNEVNYGALLVRGTGGAFVYMDPNQLDKLLALLPMTQEE